MRNKPEAIVKESTTGIDIHSSFNVSTPCTITSPIISTPINTTIDYVAWDFAGQLEYATFHPVSYLPHSFIQLDIDILRLIYL